MSSVPISLKRDFEDEWPAIQNPIITREGYEIDTSTLSWSLPLPEEREYILKFDKVLETGLRWVLQRFIQTHLEQTSTSYGHNLFNNIHHKILRYQEKYDLGEETSKYLTKEKLISLFEMGILDARSKHRLWGMYGPSRWYIWSAENYPELGFCKLYAQQLQAITYGGQPKGEAVRTQDPEKGPIHPSLELPLLLKALRSDNSREFRHLQQKVVLALSLAFGRNPKNLTYIKEKDLIDLTPDNDQPCWILRVPRIKKRQLHPRDDFQNEYLEPEFVEYLLDLIEANRTVSTELQPNNQIIFVEKPLLINVKGNKAALYTSLFDDAFNFTSEDIYDLLKEFVKRHQIISPLTDKLISISSRRLRYTLATNLAAEGISKRELAKVLDHSDTQNVGVYFEVSGRIVEHLDKAIAKEFASYLDLFKGKLISDPTKAANYQRQDKSLFFQSESNPSDQTEIGICGESKICHLDPPFSCYLCPKFQAYKQADHEKVLDLLLQDREHKLQKYEQKRLGIQLDQVIYAVSQVVELCKGEKNG
ncbi:site-specific integrase [Phormidium tenue]|uniref:Integrase n=1 Tax=Phormidium tenue NIES-30 TaxID=549789 RepID=A0A1U7J5K9_9CYAN|nr:site-specific integrase [Phormidium tenue]MBD2232517.1 site-specific integrase [Phormidium tenue FACHB-1052]OKH48005.1 integrase [Phormidium tenue NIES-30]